MNASSIALFVRVITVSTAARAGISTAPIEAVDVTVVDAPTPQRIVGIEWNSVPSLALGKQNVTVVIVPANHHALVITPFFASTTTAPIDVFDDSGNPTQLPQQTFTGFGGELGYRYYFGLAGPRGFFVGPSLVVGSFTASAQDGSHMHYWSYGLAADVGYEAIVANCVSLSAGAGLQLNWTDQAIPQQQFPANFYANRGLFPRILLAIGWVF